MNEVTRPQFSGEIAISIPDVPEVKHNLEELESFAIDLKEFYRNLVFNEDNIVQASKEKAEVNKLIDKVKRLRIDKVKEYKQPIDNFEKTAKNIESLLKDAVSSIQMFTDKAEEKRKVDKDANIIEPILNALISDAFNKGHLIDKNRIVYDPRWYNKTFKDEDIEKDITLQISNMIIEEETMKSDIETIKGFNSVNEDVYIERYKHTRDLGSIIRDIQLNQNTKKVIDNSNMFETPDTKVSKTFVGTEEQMCKLVAIAKNLGMEVL